MTTTVTQKMSKPRARPRPRDATTLLRSDHKLVSELFASYEATKFLHKKKQFVEQICEELTVHAQVEEELFYPAVQEALNDHELIPKALVEHAALKDMIAQIENLEPGGDMFDAKIKVLAEYVKHHVKEEQNEIFPLAKSSNLDMKELGAQIEQRKAELLDERKCFTGC